jgi:hypothetical protein|tara:strand:- start:58 stop:570 length:513 start_codon:yes stop_codon:yes gene_type:complete
MSDNNMNIKNLFSTQGKKDILWKKNEVKLKKWFKSNLILLRTMDENSSDFDNDYKDRAFYRLMVGYYGVGYGNGFSSGLASNNASVGNIKTTLDHWAGMTEVGRYVHEVFKKSEYNIDWMLNEWLYDNLHLWATIKVTKEEHKKENIIRNNHSLEEKNELKHYINFSGLK